VAHIGADHTNDAFAANDFAILAKLLYGGADFHICVLFLRARRAAISARCPAILLPVHKDAAL
jgi:hypothetical protein